MASGTPAVTRGNTRASPQSASVSGTADTAHGGTSSIDEAIILRLRQQLNDADCATTSLSAQLSAAKERLQQAQNENQRIAAQASAAVSVSEELAQQVARLQAQLDMTIMASKHTTPSVTSHPAVAAEAQCDGDHGSDDTAPAAGRSGVLDVDGVKTAAVQEAEDEDQNQHQDNVHFQAIGSDYTSSTAAASAAASAADSNGNDDGDDCSYDLSEFDACFGPDTQAHDGPPSSTATTPIPTSGEEAEAEEAPVEGASKERAAEDESDGASTGGDGGSSGRDQAAGGDADAEDETATWGTEEAAEAAIAAAAATPRPKESHVRAPSHMADAAAAVAPDLQLQCSPAYSQDLHKSYATRPSTAAAAAAVPAAVSHPRPRFIRPQSASAAASRTRSRSSGDSTPRGRGPIGIIHTALLPSDHTDGPTDDEAAPAYASPSHTIPRPTTAPQSPPTIYSSVRSPTPPSLSPARASRTVCAAAAAGIGGYDSGALVVVADAADSSSGSSPVRGRPTSS